MKVSVEINGVELKLDGEVDETVEFVSKLQAKDKEVEQVREAIKAERIEKTTELNKMQFDLWSWLVDNDCVDGVPISAAARQFEISEGTVGQRMAVLARMGYAYRPHRGRYRAKEKD